MKFIKIGVFFAMACVSAIDSFVYAAAAAIERVFTESIASLDRLFALAFPAQAPALAMAGYHHNERAYAGEARHRARTFLRRQDERDSGRGPPLNASSSPGSL
jgi:hypothetical protein